jgi:nucleoside-diphosphate-sugar epimerase
MKTILVTGGAGYVGTVVVRELLSKGYTVKVFDKLIFGDEALEKFKKRIELIRGDIREFNDEVLDGVSGVVHLAGFSNDPMADYNPKVNTDVNTLGTKVVAEACARKGINRFIYASSASLYDQGISGEITLQDENSPVSPSGPYSSSKYAGEIELLKIMENYPNFCPVILRMGTIAGYSPKMRFDLCVNIFVREAFLNKKIFVFCKGQQWRPLVDVNDVARAYVACMEADDEKVKGQIFNLAYDNYQMIELAHRVKHALKGVVDDLDIEIDYNENVVDRNYKVSGKKIEEVLGFRYKVPMEDSARGVAEKIKEGEFQDLHDPKFYALKWVEFLTDIKKKLDDMGGDVF